MFLSWFYFPFLGIVAFIYWMLPKQKIRNIFLSFVSFVFIYWFDKKSIVVILGLTIFTFAIASWIEKRNGGKLAHTIGVIGLIIILAIFKYLGFLSGILNSLVSFVHQLPSFQIEKLFLPLGISYIIFKYISYITDIYWGTLKKGSFVDLLCYGSLFTILEAGPIERFERMQPQLESSKIIFDVKHVEVAIERIIFGLLLKQVIANRLAEYTITFWQDPSKYSLVAQVTALFGYSLQIYFDFAGYSSIAIGSSRLLGLKIMENFDNPYLSSNISQFWRRWHISLSDWIRDYIYFPLSQNQSNRFWILICVPIISMSLCGLWHGASWNFVIWGAWHGVGIVIYQNWNKYKRQHKKSVLALNTPLISFVAMIITFIYVSLGWMLFLSTDISHVTDILIKHGGKALSIRSTVLILVLLLCIFLVPNYNNILKKLSEKRYYQFLKWLTLFIILECILNLSSAKTLFIYAGF